MQPTPSQLPNSIGRFRIESLLGRGGMGEVYKAIDPTLQRTVAVKTVRPDIDRPEYLERLYREAQACARLHHPNIVTVFEAGEIDGLVYIAMEYLQGENLSEKLARGGMTFEEKIGTIVQILSALEHAHGQEVVHRDIKPSNIYVQPDGVIKLVDFGLARMVRADTLTISGTIVGTPHYASPEQLRGEPIDGRTDVYSTGALAYEMLSGRLPFRGEDDSSITAVILRVISQPAPPMDTAMTRMLPDIERIVTRAMAKARDARYQSAKEMRSDLVSFLASSSDTIRKIDSQADRTIVLPKSDGAITVTTRPEPETRSTAIPPVVAAPPSVAAPPVAEAASRRPMWWMAGAAAAIILAVAIWMLRTPAPAADAAAVVTQPPVAENGAAPPPPVTPAAAPADTKPVTPAAKTNVAAVPLNVVTKPAETPVDVPASAARPIDAKQAFTSATPLNAGLRYRLVQDSPDGVRSVDDATRFKNGDKVRFIFESNVDGYLYVITQGSSGNWDVLFPHPEINAGKNAIRHGEEHSVPNDDWFEFDGPPGTDQVFVIFSREQLAALPGLSRPVTNVAKLSASVVNEVKSTIQSRDLVFKKDKTAAANGKPPAQVTYIVNPTEIGKSVSATIQLSHGQ